MFEGSVGSLSKGSNKGISINFQSIKLSKIDLRVNFAVLRSVVEHLSKVFQTSQIYFKDFRLLSFINFLFQDTSKNTPDDNILV